MKKISAIVLGLVATASFAAAAGLNSAQIDSILNLLRSFGADQATIDNVNAALNGEATTGNAGTTTTTPATTQSTFVYKRLLKIGKKGMDVKALQSCLNRLGNNTGVADGIFGRNTAAGVKSFQAEHGLAVDGIVGPQTGPVFESACAGTTTETGETTETGNGVTGNKLVVSSVAANDEFVGTDRKFTYAKVVLKAGDNDVKIKNTIIEVSNEAGIAKVMLLDDVRDEIGSDSSANSDHEYKIGDDIVVKSGEEKTIYVAAKTAADISGVEGLETTIEKVEFETDGADVEGEVKGGVFTYNVHAPAADKFTADISSRGDGKIAIDEKEEVGRLEIENKEDVDGAIKVLSVVLKRTEDAANDTAGKDALDYIELKADGKTFKATEDDKEYSFDLDNFEIAEDGKVRFEILAKAKEDAGKKVELEIKEINAVNKDGEDLTLSSGAGDKFNFEIQGDKITIKTGDDLDSDKVAAGKTGAELGTFNTEVEGEDVTADVEIQFTTNADAADAENMSLDNVAIYTKDGNKISDEESVDFDNTHLTQTVTFSDVSFNASDDDLEFVVKGDINKDSVNGKTITLDKVTITDPKVDSDEDVTIDPAAGKAIAQTVTIEGAVLTVKLKDADDATVNDGADEVAVAEVELNAEDSGDDIKVSTLNVKYTGTGAATEVEDCALYDGNDRVSNREDANATKMTFDLDNVVVTAGTKKTLVVKCNLTDDLAKDDTVAFAGDVDAANVNDVEYEGSTTEAEANVDITGTSTATIVEGTVEFTADTDYTDGTARMFKDGDEALLAVFELKAKDGDVKVENIVAKIDHANGLDDAKLKLYKVKADNSKDGSVIDDQTMTDNTNATFDTENLEIKDKEVVRFGLFADMKTYATPSTVSTVEVKLKDVAAAVATAQDFNKFTVVDALPVVTAVEGSTSLSTTPKYVDLVSFKVKADGGDVKFNEVKADIVDYNGVSLWDGGEIKLYRGTTELATVTVAEADRKAGTVLDFNAGAGLAEETISEGDTETYTIKAKVSATDNGDGITVRIKKAHADGINFTTPAYDLEEDITKTLVK